MTIADSPFAGKLWLAPLTVGGNLPFRRLCVELGAQVTVGEMAVALKLLRDKRGEFALLRSHPDEPFFGAQLAARNPDNAAECAEIAEQRGARFVDLNCGCPIDEITGRGLGSSLLKKPGRLGRIVEAMRKAVTIPITVKLRTGWHVGEENVHEVARLCEEAGASALTIHGRTREQRYSRAADWDLIGAVAGERGIPVVGNGDILTWFEAHERWQRSGVSSLMLARGALISPWLFREIHLRASLLPSAEQRLEWTYRLVELQREHFGGDELGVKRARRFLVWHLDFLHRYRPYPAEVYEERSREHPLIHLRELGEVPSSPLEALLRDPRTAVHERFADALQAAPSLAEARGAAQALAENLPADEPDARASVEAELVPAG